MNGAIIPPRRRRTLNESPSEKEGKFTGTIKALSVDPLNESPSEKEGKWLKNLVMVSFLCTLNESPSEKEGKCLSAPNLANGLSALNESPSEKEGKSCVELSRASFEFLPSMKAPPKRKGNAALAPYRLDQVVPQ